MISGVYLIFNKKTGKRYIGSALRIKSRVDDHFRCLGKGNHHSHHLQRAYNRYGRKAFSWSVLEETKPIRESLLTAEQKWLDHHRSYDHTLGYNICAKAGSTQGKPHSAKTRRKISMIAKRQLADGTRKHPRPNAGKRFSKKWRAALSAGQKKRYANGVSSWNKGKKGAYAHTPEVKRKIAEATRKAWEEGRMQGRKFSPEECAANSLRAKKQWELRERMPKDPSTGRFVAKGKR